MCTDNCITTFLLKSYLIWCIDSHTRSPASTTNYNPTYSHARIGGAHLMSGVAPFKWNMPDVSRAAARASPASPPPPSPALSPLASLLACRPAWQPFRTKIHSTKWLYTRRGACRQCIHNKTTGKSAYEGWA